MKALFALFFIVILAGILLLADDIRAFFRDNPLPPDD